MGEEPSWSPTSSSFSSSGGLSIFLSLASDSFQAAAALVSGTWCLLSEVRVQLVDWPVADLDVGVGYGQVMATTCVLTYYCTLIGLSLYYLGSSLYPTLPWTDCDPQVVWEPLLNPKEGYVNIKINQMKNNDQVVIPDRICLPSKPVLVAKNLTRCCVLLLSWSQRWKRQFE